MQEKVKNLVTTIVSQDSRLAVVVGILDQGKTDFFCYGHPFEKSENVATPDTIFEIASASKVFTITLLALLIKDSLVSLDEPICNLFPEIQYSLRKITLLELATHSSGLPTMPSNVLSHFLRNPRNPDATYIYAELFRSLKSFKVRSSMPVQYNYSNVGYALLGYLLAKCSNQTYETVLQDKVCHPLRLKDTTFHLTSEQRQRLATGFSSPGRLASNWEMGALEGAGGLLSCAHDLARFLQAHLGVIEELSEQVRTLCHQTRARISPNSQIALGWMVDELDNGSARIYWKDGASTGYRSFLDFSKE